MNTASIPLLIVDDDPVFVAYLKGLLAALGDTLPCALQSVDTAQAALSELKLHHYDLMLLDNHLPGLRGLDLLSQIRKLPVSQQPAVIMLTGSGNEEVAVEAMKRGAKDYLVKVGLDVPPLWRAISSALAHKRLEDQLARADEQKQEDLRLAHELQLALLPQAFPCFPPAATPEQSALRFSYKYLPTTELAGDFFDVFAVSPTTAGVIICDVMGHGVRASLVTAMLRVLVEKCAPSASEPERFLSAVNQGLKALLGPMNSPIFASAFYLVADSTSGELRYSSAGHPSPLHLRRSAGSVEPLKFPQGAHGPSLGLFEDAAFPAAHCQLAPGDEVVLFTDGLFEVLGENEEEYGMERLLATVRQRLQLPADKLFDELLDDVRRFATSRQFIDDVCLVGMERRA